MSNSVNKKLRIFFIPFFASGHMIPMADFAALLARRPDVDPTICLTQANADVLRPTLDPSINVLLYPFPSEAAGLPPGHENISSVPADQEWKINKAADLSEPTHRKLLHEHRPDAVVSDIHLWWTTGIAADLGIPRITWHAVGVFPQLVILSLDKYRIETIGVSDGVITVKDLTGPAIKMPVSELPEFLRSNDFLSKVWDKMMRANLDCYGVIVNTFYEMEPTYCDHYRAVEYKRAWFVGPVALARGHNKDAERGHEWLNWLDSKEEGSVVFVCYGSWCQFKDEQLKAMAVGLEMSGQSFLWVVRKSEGDWLPDQKWEDRVKGRGKVVTGWVPQVAILGHKAVGAFLTHCGWNSVMESVAAGLPMLTWPLVFEQFINEKLVVEAAGIGEPVWRGFRSTREEEKVVVPAEAIAKKKARVFGHHCSPFFSQILIPIMAEAVADAPQPIPEENPSISVNVETLETQKETNGASKRGREEEGEEEKSKDETLKKPKVDDEMKEAAEVEMEEEKLVSAKLGPKEFDSGEGMFNYFIRFLHCWPPNIDINKYEYMVLLELLKKGHAEPDKKIGGGIKAFQVRYHPVWKSRCFFLVRVDGSSDDFSFRKCVDQILPLPENMKVHSSNGNKSNDGKKFGGHHKGGGGGGGRGGRGGHGRGGRGGFRK